MDSLICSEALDTGDGSVRFLSFAHAEVRSPSSSRLLLSSEASQICRVEAAQKTLLLCSARHLRVVG